MSSISVTPVEGMGQVRAGDDLAQTIVEAAGADGIRHHDVLVITQKVVSKAEGRFAEMTDKDLVVARESRRILRRSGGMTISETHHGLVCANAGVDASNVEGDRVVSLPVDPDASARSIRARVAHLTGVEVGVVISDTFGRAWRLGQTDVAIGVAGFDPFVDLRGTTDAHGKTLSATRICIADELAGAGEMAMGKARGIPAAIVRGAPVVFGSGAAAEIVRAPADDLFR